MGGYDVVPLQVNVLERPNDSYASFNTMEINFFEKQSNDRAHVTYKSECTNSSAKKRCKCVVQQQHTLNPHPIKYVAESSSSASSKTNSCNKFASHNSARALHGRLHPVL